MTEMNAPNNSKTQKQHKTSYILYILFCSLLAISIYKFFVKHPDDLSKKVVTPQSVLSPDQLCQNKNCLLRNHAVSELKLIGTLTGPKHQWAFISDINHQLTKIQTGDFIGQHPLQVEDISATHITLIDSNNHNKRILRITS
jgi:hypothetical protein